MVILMIGMLEYKEGQLIGHWWAYDDACSTADEYENLCDDEICIKLQR